MFCSCWLHGHPLSPRLGGSCYRHCSCVLKPKFFGAPQHFEAQSTPCICTNMRTNTEHMRTFAQNISAFEMNDRPFFFFFSSMLPLRFTPQAVQYEKNKRIFSMMILCLLVYLQDTCAFSSGASLGSVSGFSRRHASFSRRHASFRCLRSYRHLVPLHVLMADWQQATDTATG